MSTMISEPNALRKSCARRTRNGQAPPIVQSRILCRNRMHTIALDKHGHLVLYDHTREQIQREFDVETLGGEVCKCLQVMRWWRQAIREGKGFSHLPEGIKV